MSVQSITSSITNLLRSPDYEEQELLAALDSVDAVSYECSDPTFILGSTSTGEEFFDNENRAIATTAAQERVADVDLTVIAPPTGVDIGGQLADSLDGVAAGIDDSISQAVSSAGTIIGSIGDAGAKIFGSLGKVFLPVAIGAAAVLGFVLLKPKSKIEKNDRRGVAPSGAQAPDSLEDENSDDDL